MRIGLHANALNPIVRARIQLSRVEHDGRQFRYIPNPSLGPLAKMQDTIQRPRKCMCLINS